MKDQVKIGNRSFDVAHLMEVVRLAQVYLDTRPQHSHGFCRWLTDRGCPAYYTITVVRYHWAGGWSRSEYVDDKSGPTEKRLLFVRQLHDYLTGVLALADAHGPVHVPVRPPANIDSYLDTMEEPPSCPVIKPGTQVQRVLQALQEGQNELRVIAAFAGCLETAASARIRELRTKYGWNIETRRAPGRAQRYTYHLIGA